MKTLSENFSSLCDVISRLRGESGCPWDQKQNTETLQKYVREESGELLEAMAAKDPTHICEEIGDMLFLLVLLSEIHSERNDFTINDAIQGIHEKMIRRHPHVFADVPAGNDQELKKQWETIKAAEKEKKTN